MKKLYALFIGLFMLYGSLSYAQSRCADGCDMYNVYFEIDVKYLPPTPPTAVLSPIEEENTRLSRSIVIHKRVNFVMDDVIKGTFLQLPSINFVPTTVLVNLDDGNGWQTSSLGGTTSTVYSNGGDKTISVRLIKQVPGPLGTTINTYDKTFTKTLTVLDNPNESYTAPDEIWNLETPTAFTPPCANAYPSGHFYSETRKGYANAYIKYANSDHILRKPVIFVDGFDFNKNAYIDPSSGQVIRYGSLGWDALVQGLIESKNEQIFALMPNQIDTFQQDGYDLIFLDFKDGTDYIQRNAILLKELIREINRVKSCDSEDIIVIGASMGGQIARFALTQMEQDGETHAVRTYVSFDSPQQGANVPIGLQAALWGITHLPDPSSIDSNAITLWEGLNSPAAQELLYETFLGADANNTINLVLTNVDLANQVQGNYNLSNFQDVSLDFTCLRNTFKTERNNLGYPQKARNVAIINGSKNALGQGFTGLGFLLRAESTQLGTSAFNVSMRDADATPLLRFKTPSDYFALISSVPSDFRRMLVYPINQKAYSSKPGSMQTFTGLLAEELGNSPVLKVTSHQRTHCFMPSISTLDINTNDLSLNISQAISTGQFSMPFEDYYAPDDNEFHVEITHGNLTWLNDELPKSRNLLNGLTVGSGTVFNFGANNGGRFSLLNNFTITNGGIVHLNKFDEPLGFANSGNPVPSSGGFEAHLGKCGVVVEDGGLLNVGSTSWNYRATLRVPDGTTLHVKDGGRINIKGYSQLIVEEGGTLIIEEGGLINYWGDNLNNAPTLRVEGTLIVQNGSETAELRGTGRLQVAEGAVVDIQTGAHLWLGGSDRDETILELGKSVQFGVDGNARLTIDGGAVDYNGSNTSIITHNGGTLMMNEVDLNGTGTIGISTDAPAQVNLNDVAFNGMSEGWHLENGSEAGAFGYRLENCTFTNCWTGVAVNKTAALRVAHSTFTGSNLALNAISAVRTELLRINDCTISDYNTSSILLDEVPIALFIDTDIDNNGTGIDAQNMSNVFLSEGSVISNNQIAIQMLGDAENGMVTMDCATLDNNTNGIIGTDVLLNIDAEINATDPNYISPNTFKNINSSSGRLFDICYVERNINEIFMKGNYWDGMSGLSSSDYRIYNSGGGACPNNQSNVTLDFTDYMTNLPQGCNTTPSGGSTAPGNLI